eukprot:m.7690 g.7690  ORF g.7690 m.7690 type:complete len:138 (+) comp19412_c0_seq1:806-1219(+)
MDMSNLLNWTKWKKQSSIWMVVRLMDWRFRPKRHCLHGRYLLHQKNLLLQEEDGVLLGEDPQEEDPLLAEGGALRIEKGIGRHHLDIEDRLIREGVGLGLLGGGDTVEGHQGGDPGLHRVRRDRGQIRVHQIHQDNS